MTKKQKLELTWIGEENRPPLEPRTLREDLLASGLAQQARLASPYHAAYRVSNGGLFGNNFNFL